MGLLFSKKIIKTIYTELWALPYTYSIPEILHFPLNMTIYSCIQLFIYVTLFI